MAIEVKTKKWGNSIGIVIPSEAVAEESIKAGDTIRLLIGKDEDVVSKMFGRAKMKKTLMAQLLGH
mgnify:CR=1 FL=1